MRRAERLFQIVQLVRSRRLSTGPWLADRLQVSARTVYRDIAELQLQGVPIEGEAGVGYRMRAGFELPPLMFTTPEAQALVASVRLAQPRLDPELAHQAESALGKILAVLPLAARTAADALALYAPVAPVDEATRARLGVLRHAIDGKQLLDIVYLDLQGSASQRRVRPLAVFHWEAVWTLAAWCELRQDFRNFRVDRIQALQVLEERFRDEAGRSLAELVRRAAAEHGFNPG